MSPSSTRDSASQVSVFVLVLVFRISSAASSSRYLARGFQLSLAGFPVEFGGVYRELHRVFCHG